MTLNDPVADSLSKINNAVKALYKSIDLKKSKLLLAILEVLKQNNYVGSYEIIEDGRQGIVRVNLTAPPINDTKEISKRRSKLRDLINWYYYYK